MATRDRLASTKQALRAFQAPRHLIERRDPQALYLQRFKHEVADELRIKNPLVRDAIGVALLALSMVVDASDLKEDMTRKLRGKRQGCSDYIGDSHFGSLVLSPVKTTYNKSYTFTDGLRHIGYKCIELHLEPRIGTGPRDILYGLGQAAVHIGEDANLSQRPYVTSVSYPELIRGSVRLGMRPAPVHINESWYAESIQTYQDVYYLMNGLQRTQPLVPAASFLPTTQFVDTFAKFAN